MQHKINTDLIREYLIKYDLSKHEFCKRCNMSLYTLDKIFKQRANVNIISLFKIAREMDLSIGDLIIE